MRIRWLPSVLAMAVCAACAAGQSPNSPAAMPSAPAGTTTSDAPQGPSFADRIQAWKARAAVHFSESADALGQLSESSAAGDDAALRAGCQRLHDTNSIGLQQDLPSPDAGLTDELQRMIDDMNTATHACTRYTLAGDDASSAVEAATYQEYLGRAVTHLQRAKSILNAVEN